MNRRRFLQLLGLAPLLPAAAKLPAPAPEVLPGLTLAKLLAAKKILDDNDAQWEAIEANLANGEVEPGFLIEQRLEHRADMCHALQLTTMVRMEDREPLYRIMLFDEIPTVADIEKEKTAAIVGTRKYWTQRDRWARKAKAALFRLS